ALGVGERSGRPAPFSTVGRSLDGAASPLGLGQDGVDLLRRADVVGELDPRCSVPAECCPEAEDHPSGLEEADLVIRLTSAGPTERLVEGARLGEVAHAKRYKTDPLLHARSISRRAGRC